ncbi:uncharacterized protein TNCV_3764391 [Trichonephila clavipes]|uniref:TIL domain-containing protein n=1 Tax=Trichonephila clavipes TaxID=2585209 RepID=A0A8X6VVH6_TRICX|nr:uncharacterized protein TNCV_3764391 [Trichonephila clavipes]
MCGAYPACQKTCKNYDKDFPCPLICQAGCICKEGYVEGPNKECIREEECRHYSEGSFAMREKGGNRLVSGPDYMVKAAVAEWYRHRIVAGFVTSSSLVPLKTRRVGQRCTLNLSRAETSSRWCGVVVRRGGCQLRCRPRHLTMVQNYVVRRQKPSCS